MSQLKEVFESNIILKTVKMRFIGVDKINQKSILKENAKKRGVHYFENRRDNKKYIYLIFAAKIKDQVVKIKVALEKEYYDDPEKHFKRSFPFEKNFFYELVLRVWNFAEANGKGLIFFLEYYKPVSSKKVKELLKTTYFIEQQFTSNLKIENIKLIRYDYLFEPLEQIDLILKKNLDTPEYNVLGIINHQNPTYKINVNDKIKESDLDINSIKMKSLGEGKLLLDFSTSHHLLKFVLDYDKTNNRNHLKLIIENKKRARGSFLFFEKHLYIKQS